MIGFERPLLLPLFLVAALLLWWWHRRRRRPVAVTVSSLLIWDRLGAMADAPRRRRHGWVLLLETAAALALTLAAAGPFRPVAAPRVARLTVLVDRRPGMGATDRTGRTRLERAREALAGHLHAMPPGTRVQVLTVPPAPEGVHSFPAGGAEADAVLATLSVATRSGDFEAAVASLAARGGPRLVVTDEPVPAGIDGAAGPAWLSVGAPATNVGIVWARGVRSEKGATRLSVGVMNGGTEAVRTRVALEHGGRRVREVPVSLAPGEVRALPELPLEPVADHDGWRVTIPGRDALAADDAVRIRRAARPSIALVARESVPDAVRAALSALGPPPEEVAAGDVPPPPAVYWKVVPDPRARLPWLWVGCEGEVDGLRLGSGYRPGAVAAGPDAAPVGGVATAPRRVVRALRVTGEAGWRVRLAGTDAAGRRWPLILDRPDGATVLAFDPVRDAPGWPSTASFPAFFFGAVGRAAGGLCADGLLSSADTQLGREPASPSMEFPAGDGPAEEGRESLAAWLLLVSALALIGICLLEV